MQVKLKSPKIYSSCTKPSSSSCAVLTTTNTFHSDGSDLVLTFNKTPKQDVSSFVSFGKPLKITLRHESSYVCSSVLNSLNSYSSTQHCCAQCLLRHLHSICFDSGIFVLIFRNLCFMSHLSHVCLT